MKKLFNSQDELVYRRSEDLDKSVIGKGTFSEVRLVSHKDNPNKLYALKDMEKTNECEIVYIKKEIDIHIQLNHPNIVKFYDYLELEDSFLFFLEYCENGDLFDYMVKKKPSKTFLLEKFYELCKAVKYLHEKNIMHRDLKPENIFLDKNLKVKLGDFGWSAVYSDKSIRESLCGTLFYNAYEIFAENKQTKKTDIWSLGILLYLFFHNYVPFQGENVVQMMKILKNCEKLLTFRKSIDPQVKDLIKKILRLNPAKRPNIDQILSHPVFDQFKQNNKQKQKKNFVLLRQPQAFKKNKIDFKKKINNAKSPLNKKASKKLQDKSSGSKHKILSVKSKNSSSQQKQLANTSVETFNKSKKEKNKNTKFINIKVNKSIKNLKKKFQLQNDKKWFNIYAKQKKNNQEEHQKPRKISDQLHVKIRPSVDKMQNLNIQKVAISKRLSISNKKNFYTNNNRQSIYQPTVLNEYFHSNENKSESSTIKDFRAFKNKKKLKNESLSKDQNKKRQSTSSSIKPYYTDLRNYNKKNTISNTDNTMNLKLNALKKNKIKNLKEKHQVSTDIKRKDKSKNKVNTHQMIKDLEIKIRKIKSIKNLN